MRRLILISQLLNLSDIPLRAGNLYSTDFESFAAGDNQWAGTEGWICSDTTNGVQGILSNPVQNLDLGKTAYLGFEPPSEALTTVYKPINYDPASGKIPFVEFDSLLGVQDSTSTRRDRFYISFYNIAGDYLAAICFDNSTGEVFRDDGLLRTGCNVDFIRGNQLLGLVALQVLTARIDLANNQWSATLDGITLFTNAPFTVTGQPRTLGSSAAEWEITKTTPTLTAGNNWLFVADWNLRTAPLGTEPFQISSFTRNSDGSRTLAWPGEPGFDYRIEHSSDLSTWHSDLPGASFPTIQNTGPLSFTDTTPTPAKMFYRAVREVSP